MIGLPHTVVIPTPTSKKNDTRSTFYGLFPLPFDSSRRERHTGVHLVRLHELARARKALETRCHGALASGLHGTKTVVGHDVAGRRQHSGRS